MRYFAAEDFFIGLRITGMNPAPWLIFYQAWGILVFLP